MAIIPFALHSNASDDDVWGVVEKAKDMCFEVELLSHEQLNPTDLGMDENRSLVHTLRLTKQFDIIHISCQYVNLANSILRYILEQLSKNLLIADSRLLDDTNYP